MKNPFDDIHYVPTVFSVFSNLDKKVLILKHEPSLLAMVTEDNLDELCQIIKDKYL